jgi:hypothetical protein
MIDPPDWVLDLVAAAERFEAVHPPGGCLAAALTAVPNDVRAEARGWARAKRHSTPAAEAPTFEAGSVLHTERASGPEYVDPHQGDARRPAGFAHTRAGRVPR